MRRGRGGEEGGGKEKRRKGRIRKGRLAGRGCWVVRRKGSGRRK